MMVVVYREHSLVLLSSQTPDVGLIENQILNQM